MYSIIMLIFRIKYIILLFVRLSAVLFYNYKILNLVMLSTLVLCLLDLYLLNDCFFSFIILWSFKLKDGFWYSNKKLYISFLPIATVVLFEFPYHPIGIILTAIFIWCLINHCLRKTILKFYDNLKWLIIFSTSWQTPLLWLNSYYNNI